MARKRIASWPPAHRKYHPTRQQGFKFEKQAEARKRDHERSIILAGQPDIAVANKKLIGSLAKPRRHPRSMASARYIRRRRIAFNSQCHRLLDRCPGPAKFCTLIPSGWLIPADELATVVPRNFLAQIRSMLNRAGIGQASGWAVLVLDLEYVEHLDSWSFHVHGIFTGGKAQALHLLRTKPKLKQCADHADIGKRPMQVKIIVAGTEARTVNYLIKTYFGMRLYREWDEKMLRATGRTAVPDRRQTELLVWLNKWTIDDFVLKNGIFFGENRLRISKRRIHL